MIIKNILNTIVVPEAIVEYIISFICDRRGYNIILYNQRKKINIPRMNRIITEIKFFNNLGCSIPWLKPTKEQNKNSFLFKKKLKKGKASIVYHTGCYKGNWQEEAETQLIRRQEINLRRILNR